MTKAKDARKRLSDLEHALNQVSQALEVQLPQLSPDFAAGLQRFKDEFDALNAAVGEGLTPDVVAAIQRIDDWNRLATNSLGEGLTPDVVAAIHAAIQLAETSAAAIGAAVRLESPAPPQDLQADSILESAGAAKARGKPKGRPLSAETLKMLSVHDKLGNPAINNKVCAEIAKKLKLEPETNTSAARAKLYKQIYATLYRHRKTPKRMARRGSAVNSGGSTA